MAKGTWQGKNYVAPNGEWLGSLDTPWGKPMKYPVQVMYVLGERADGQPRRGSKTKNFGTEAEAKAYIEANATPTGGPHLYPKGTKGAYTKDSRSARLHRALDAVLDGWR